jgi:hypothetical protein
MRLPVRAFGHAAIAVRDLLAQQSLHAMGIPVNPRVVKDAEVVSRTQGQRFEIEPPG